MLSLSFLFPAVRLIYGIYFRYNMKIRAENERLEHDYKTVAFSNYSEFRIGWGFIVHNSINKVKYFIYN